MLEIISVQHGTEAVAEDTEDAVVQWLDRINVDQAIIANDVEMINLWAVVIIDGVRTAYCGTQETFDAWRKKLINQRVGRGLTRIRRSPPKG